MKKLGLSLLVLFILLIRVAPVSAQENSSLGGGGTAEVFAFQDN